MANFLLQMDFTGTENVFPRLGRMISMDSFATITTPGYLTGWLREGGTIYPSDRILVTFNATSLQAGAAGITGDFSVVIVNGVVTLQPFLAHNLFYFDVTCTEAALASAGKVTLVPSYNQETYRIRNLQLNLGGTNFSGGSGNRLGQVTDGTTVYSLIPAADLQTLVNAQWGATALPNPASAAINTATQPGANLYFAYSGGTTDYTAGSLVISGVAERLA